MQIPIEILAILFLAFIFFMWLVYMAISKWWLKMRYNPNDDKSRRTGEERYERGSKVATRTFGSSEQDFVIPRPSELTERTNIQATITNPDRENSNSRRTPSNRIRNLLKRTRS